MPIAEERHCVDLSVPGFCWETRGSVRPPGLGGLVHVAVPAVGILTGVVVTDVTELGPVGVAAQAGVRKALVLVLTPHVGLHPGALALADGLVTPHVEELHVLDTDVVHHAAISGLTGGRGDGLVGVVGKVDAGQELVPQRRYEDPEEDDHPWDHHNEEVRR